MCGLVGVVTGKHMVKYEKYLKQALIVDVVRGVHSTGVASCGQGSFAYAKKAINSLDFVDMKCFADLLRTASVNKSGALLGHNRAATVGKVNNVNAHPFEAGNIVGMHNGTLRKYTKLEDNSFVTDSECLINHIQQHGIKDALCKIEGAYALVWYDADADKVYMVRNNDRPLWLGRVKDEDTILYASEPGMLNWIAQRTDHKLDKVWQPEENQLVTFDLSKNEKVAQPTVRKLKIVSEYPAPVTTPNYSGLPHYGNRAYGGGASRFRERTAEHIYQEWGIRENLKTQGFVCSWTPYTGNKNGLGSAEVVMLDDPWLSMTVHSVTELQMKEDMTADFIIKRVYMEHSRPQDQEPVIIAQMVEGSQEKKPEAPDIADMFRGPDDTLINKEAMHSLVKHGCCMCGDPIQEDEYPSLEWQGSNPICNGCLEDFIDYVHPEGVHA